MLDFKHRYTLLLRFIQASSMILLCLCSSLHAQGYIRDTEIENTLRVLSYPILKAGGYDIGDVEFHIINNDNLNAFVANGQRIHLYTGLMIASRTPEELQGVIAHELAHIIHGHLARMLEQIQRSEQNNLLIAAASVPLAILANRPEIAVGGIGLGATVAERGFLKFSRGMEEEADQSAVQLLNKAKISLKGMTDFFDLLLKREELYGTQNIIYASTHPLTKKRKEFLQTQLHTSPHIDPQQQAIYIQFQRMRAKLIGYLYPLEKVLTFFPMKNKSFYALYARAFAYAARGKTDKAIAEITPLIEQYPNDIFLKDAYGDILRDSGQLNDALTQYRQALKQLPWANLIRLNIAHILLELQGVAAQQEILNHLDTAKIKEFENPELWRLYAQIYSQSNQPINAMLAHSQYAYLTGNFPQARNFAHKVIKQTNDAQYISLKQQAEDILNEINNLEAKMREKN